MSNALLSSKVTITESEPEVRTIPTLPTIVVAALGITERGPVGVPTLCTSWTEFLSIFGGYVAAGYLAPCVQNLYELAGDGTPVWVTRVVHYSPDNTSQANKQSAKATRTLLTAATAATAGTVLGTVVGPFDLDGNNVLTVERDGAAAATATFTGTQAAVENTSAAPYALTDGGTLTLKINGGALQTLTFATAEFVAIGAATLQEVINALNAKLSGASAVFSSGDTRFTIKSHRKGTTSSVEIVGGTNRAALGLAIGTTNSVGSNVANIAAVTVAEVKTLVEAALAGITVSDVGGAVQIARNTTGPTSTIQVHASSTADDELGLDNAIHTGTSGTAVNTLRVDGKYDGAYANELVPVVEASTSGDASEFNLKILDGDGFIVNSFANLTMDSTLPRYAPTIVNAATGSKLVEVVDLAAGGTPTQRRPANVTALALSGGNDGLVGLVDADFIGSSAGLTGFRSYDNVQGLRVLMCPDRATAAAAVAQVNYCEVIRGGSMFAVLDPPAGRTYQTIVDYVTSETGLYETTEFGALYWPRAKILNPSRAVFGDTDLLTVPPSGVVVGVMARTDAASSGGVYRQPAGVEEGNVNAVVLGFEDEAVLNEDVQDILYPKNINPITTGDGLPRYINGSRTLKQQGNFPSIGERRGVIHIEQSIKAGLQFARHKNNTPKLRRRVERTVKAFLTIQTALEAFRSDNPAEAFYVDFGAARNSTVEQFAKKLNGKVGLATAKPAEFIPLEFSQDTRALEAELATQ